MPVSEALATAPTDPYQVELAVELRIGQEDVASVLLYTSCKREHVLRNSSCADRIVVAQHSPPRNHCGLETQFVFRLGFGLSIREVLCQGLLLAPTQILDPQLIISPEATLLQNRFHSFTTSYALSQDHPPLPRLNRYHRHHAPQQQTQTLAPPTQYDSEGWQCGALLGIRKKLATWRIEVCIRVWWSACLTWMPVSIKSPLCWDVS